MDESRPQKPRRWSKAQNRFAWGGYGRSDGLGRLRFADISPFRLESRATPGELMRRTEEEEFRDSAKPREGTKSWFSEPSTTRSTLKRKGRRGISMILSLILLAAILVVLSLIGFAR